MALKPKDVRPTPLDSQTRPVTLNWAGETVTIVLEVVLQGL